MFFLKTKKILIIILIISLWTCKSSAKTFFPKEAPVPSTHGSHNITVSNEIPSLKILPETPFMYEEIPIVINDQVLFYLRRFTESGKSYFAKTLHKSYRYKKLMQGILIQFGLPKDLFYLAFIESNFNNHAYSRAHACGPWQLIAQTATQYGLRIDHWIDERKDPVLSTQAAAKYLCDLYQQFGCWYLTAAAYNAGNGTIKRFIKKYNTSDWWILSKRAKRLKKEAKNYVPKWIATIMISKNPEKYGFFSAKNTPLKYDTIRTNTLLDLETIAYLCKTSLNNIKKLNPALKRTYTPPYPYFLRIPEGKKEFLLTALDKKPKLNVNRFYCYKVRPGDTLWEIAKHYGSSIPFIAKLNNLSPPYLLRPGQKLLIPQSPRKKANVRVISSKRIVYTVRPGDSFWKISRRFGIPISKIKNQNPSKRMLRPGDQLILAFD